MAVRILRHPGTVRSDRAGDARLPAKQEDHLKPCFKPRSIRRTPGPSSLPGGLTLLKHRRYRTVASRGSEVHRGGDSDDLQRGQVVRREVVRYHTAGGEITHVLPGWWG